MDETSPRSTCDQCGKQFANEAYLQHHRRSAHEVDPSVCEVCSGKYKNWRSLQRHMRYAHAVKVEIRSEHSPPLLCEDGQEYFDKADKKNATFADLRKVLIPVLMKA